MKFTTSNHSSVEADLRIHPELDLENPFKYKRVFLGLHLDFSMHQAILYLGIFHLSVAILEPKREDATVDDERILAKTKNGRAVLVWHTTNHKPHDYFFNIGTTFTAQGTSLFLWKLRLHIERRKRSSSADANAE